VTHALVTVGQQYRSVPHPMFPAAHPDGWVRVSGPTPAHVYKTIAELFTERKDDRPRYKALHWGVDTLDPKHYPLGEIAQIGAST